LGVGRYYEVINVEWPEDKGASEENEGGGRKRRKERKPAASAKWGWFLTLLLVHIRESAICLSRL